MKRIYGKGTEEKSLRIMDRGKEFTGNGQKRIYR